MPREADYVIFKADWLEVTWVGITLISLIVTLLLLENAIANSSAIEKLHVNGIRKYAARTQTYREILRVIMTSALLAIGIRAVTQPNFERPKHFDYYFVIVCLLSVAIGMAVSSLLDWYRFRVLIREAEAQGLVETVELKPTLKSKGRKSLR